MTVSEFKPDFTFKKEEKLCSTKQIAQVYAKGKTLFLHPFQIRYLSVENSNDTNSVRVLFVVGKKVQKRAVKRNLIKRRMREIYRLNKNELTSLVNSQEKSLLMAISYVDKDIRDYAFMSQRFEQLLQSLVAKI
jgi:ribonuclease P protein component